MKTRKRDPKLNERRLKSYHDSMLLLQQRSKRLRAEFDESCKPDFIELLNEYCELRLALEHEYNAFEEFIRVRASDEPATFVAVAAIARGYRGIEVELQTLFQEVNSLKMDGGHRLH